MSESAEQKLDDEDLARRAQEGELEAFDVLVQRYERAMIAYFHKQLTHEQDSLDLAQQVLVKAYRNLHRFDPRRRFKPWLYALARRQLIDHYRRRRDPVPEAPAEADLRDPAALLASRDQTDRLWRWVRARLATAVKVMLHRARKRLQREWEREEGGNP